MSTFSAALKGSFFLTPCVSVLFASPVRADLPDLRGQTLFLTGRVEATGSALGLDLANFLPPGGEPITSDNPAKMIFALTGSPDNSTLTAQFPLPSTTTTVNGTTYPGCSNPSLTLTGSFNRTTGALHLSGSLPGTSVFDFGVYDTGNPLFGIKRALLQVKNLSVTLDGTGSLAADGQFVIVQPGTSAFRFTIDSNFFTGTPRVGLQNPSSCTFGGTTATVNNPTLKLSSWRLAQPVISGTVTLQDCRNSVQPVTFTLQSGNGTDLVKTVTLDTNGGFRLVNLAAETYTVFVKGRKWLRTRTLISTLDHDEPAFATTLKSGDVNNNNTVDVDDLTLLLNVYNSTRGDGLYTDGADLNCDGKVDVDDLTSLLNNYNTQGQKSFPSHR